MITKLLGWTTPLRLTKVTCLLSLPQSEHGASSFSSDPAVVSFAKSFHMSCWDALFISARYRSLCQPRRVVPEAQLHNTDRGYWGRRAALFTWQPPSLRKHKEMIGLKNRMKVLITWPKAQKPQCYDPSVQIRIIVFFLTVWLDTDGPDSAFLNNVWFIVSLNIFAYGCWHEILLGSWHVLQRDMLYSVLHYFKVHFAVILYL